MFHFRVASAGDSTQVAKFLGDNRPEKALEEALNIPFLFQRDDALEKIVDYHLAKGDLASAELASNHISSLSSSARCLTKIFDAHFAKGDMVTARRVATGIHTLSDRDHAIEKIINYHIGKGEPERARALLSDLFSISKTSYATSKIFNYYFDKKDFENAKKTLMNASSVNSADAEKMLAHELETNQLAASVSTSRLVGKSGAKKLASKIEETKPDEATLQQIEKQVDSSFSFFWTAIAKIILEALMSVYKAMGKDDQVERLKKKIEELGEPNRVFEHLQTAFAFPLGLYAGAIASTTYGLPASALIGGTTAFAFKYPSILKVQNFLGAGAGLAASASGYGPLASLGIGLGTSFVTRIPWICDAANWTGKTAVSAVEAGLNGVAWTAENTVKGVGYAVEGIFNGIGYGLGLVGSAINGVDQALDTLSGN